MHYAVTPREVWKAKYGRGHLTSGAKTRWIAHHDGYDRSKPGMSLDEEIAIWQMFEEFHASKLTKANPRIAYTFGVFQTGRILEGTGWDRIGAHTAGLNSSAYAAVFPLNGAVTAPTPEAIAAFHWLRAEGVKLGKLTPNHIVSGHQDHGKPGCPGRKVYDAVVRGIPVIAPTTVEIIRAYPTLRLGKGGNGFTYAIAAEQTAVAYLQQRLITLGFLQPALPSGRSSATGFFGNLTERAVIRFQLGNNLKPDGIVGPRSWAKLRALRAVA